jgi:diguanylate cyclase
MSGDVLFWPDGEPGLRNADQIASDADQAASYADQAASDEDQAASESDKADAAIDQRTADEDQAVADLDLSPNDDPAERFARDRRRAARDEVRLHRLATQDARTRMGQWRDSTAEEREATAAARDEAARRRDQFAAEQERSIHESELSLAEKAEWLRIAAAQDRERAAADRERAALERAQSARQRTRLEAELRSAHLDGLTGALRREIGMLSLSHEIERARRGDGRLVIAFVDVDHMKDVNDRYGHAEGDRVLQAVVAEMRAELRPYDSVVRYGGDEFVCGIGACDLADAARRFESIDRAIHVEVGATISVGLAMLAKDESLDEVIARADAALLEVRGRRRR